MFEFIPTGTRIPFMKYRIPMIVISLALTVAALTAMIKKGFNFGVDFAGGIEMILSLPPDSGADAEALRSALLKAGIKDSSVQSYGDDGSKKGNDYIVHFPAEFAHDEVESVKVEESFASFRSAPTDKIVQSFRFSGLERAYLSLSKDIPLEEVKKTLEKNNFGLLHLQDVQKFGRDSSREYQITFLPIQNKVQQDLASFIKSPSGAQIQVQKVDFVGAKVGKDLKMGALLSLLLTALIIFVYIFIRFDLVYAPGVVVALLHDVAIAAGVFAITGTEFDLTIVAALLTLAGYSINDTIIVYDRIREVSGTLKGKSFSDIIDIAINQTLSRTIITSLTVFLANLALFIWGGPVIHGFALCFLIGVVVGTYSSAFVACPIILWMESWVRRRESLRRQAA